MNIYRVTRRHIHADESIVEAEFHAVAEGPLDALAKVWSARYPQESLREYTRLTETSWTTTNVSSDFDGMFSGPALRERLWFASKLDVIGWQG